MSTIQISKEIRSAIKSGNLEKVVELIGSNIEVLHMITPFGTWLHVAASRGELNIVKKLIELGLNVNALGGVYGGGALNEAASRGHISVVKYLLACGAELDISDPIKNPLFGAISNGYPDIAKLLIESGIDVEVKYSGESIKGMDALAFAREQGQVEIVKVIEEWTSTITETSVSNQDYHNEILEQVTKQFGAIQNTISEIVPGSRVSVNIHVIPASMNQDFVTLVTTGMSDEPMGYSSEDSESKYAELLLKLPSSWIIGKENMKDQNNYWPFAWLRKLAHIPHVYGGWLDEGVILPNGEPPQPFAANTKLSCIMVCRSQELGLHTIQGKEGRINIYTLVPIYEEERTLVLKKGHEYLLNKMSEHGITDVLDRNRINVGL
ncbi:MULTISPECIES: suppressor of fused domain protein [Bacillus cereus group]|uniref:Suppressor of fused-like domain-containing protein n=1 Tax=Bacillus cereus TaxID=1396 RepID=A0A2C1LQI2_BACCE|nr:MULTISPECIES: suppressor of fused domain protein [Bacillus cereus group]PGU07266.1 hypothetical protein COD19_01660 [Bacillus cereus]